MAAGHPEGRRVTPRSRQENQQQPLRFRQISLLTSRHGQYAVYLQPPAALATGNRDSFASRGTRGYRPASGAGLPPPGTGQILRRSQQLLPRRYRCSCPCRWHRQTDPVPALLHQNSRVPLLVLGLAPMGSRKPTMLDSVPSSKLDLTAAPAAWSSGPSAAAPQRLRLSCKFHHPGKRSSVMEAAEVYSRSSPVKSRYI